MNKLGKVVQVFERYMVILLDTGEHEVFFRNLRGYPKQLKVGDRCKVLFKQYVTGIGSYKATKLRS